MQFTLKSMKTINPRMARKHRNLPIFQDSAFLNLPAELREQIYYLALVQHNPINLQPIKYNQDSSNGRIFRFRDDIQFVRQEIATGLLTTCKQVYHKAANIFWSKNFLTFSGDIEWLGARRFLGQIGPTALSQPRSLEVFAHLQTPIALILVRSTTTIGFSGANFMRMPESKEHAEDVYGESSKGAMDHHILSQNGRLTQETTDFFWSAMLTMCPISQRQQKLGQNLEMSGYMWAVHASQAVIGKRLHVDIRNPLNDWCMVKKSIQIKNQGRTIGNLLVGGQV